MSAGLNDVHIKTKLGLRVLLKFGLTSGSLLRASTHSGKLHRGVTALSVVLKANEEQKVFRFN